MRFLNLTLDSLAGNLALDEALLLQAEAGGPEVLRIWELTTAAVVLGAGGKLADDVDESACRRDQIPIGRRASGGGTVLIGPGCLNFSLVLSYQRHPALREVNSSYRHILELTACMFTDLTPGISMAGTSDLATADRKFSGNAQQRKRDYLLHHGTILYGFDLSGVSRYLKMPSRQPDYRAGRAHADFLMNLPATAAELIRRLRSGWHADADLTDWPRWQMERLVGEKYEKDEWLRRR